MISQSQLHLFPLLLPLPLPLHLKLQSEKPGYSWKIPSERQWFLTKRCSRKQKRFLVPLSLSLLSLNIFLFLFLSPTLFLFLFPLSLFFPLSFLQAKECRHEEFMTLMATMHRSTHDLLEKIFLREDEVTKWSKKK